MSKKEHIKFKGVILGVRYSINYHKKDLLFDFAMYNNVKEIKNQSKITMKKYIRLRILNRCLEYLESDIEMEK